MKKCLRLSAALGLSMAATAMLAQAGMEADNVVAKAQGPNLTKVTWDGVANCAIPAYSVYRSTDPDFDIAPRYLVASGIKVNHYTAKETTSKDVYYRVTESCNTSSDWIEVPYDPPVRQLHSGKVTTYPLDLGAHFNADNVKEGATCEATSTSEVSCAGLSVLIYMHAVIAAQGGHEFLIGCPSDDYEGGAWNCVNLGTGLFTVSVHSKTATVMDSGYQKINIKTGKTLERIVPVFSILGTIK